MRSLVRRLRIIIGAAVATAAAATSSMVHLAEATATAATGGDYIRKGDLPNTGRDWVSLHQTVEFLPASATKSVPYFPPIAQQQQLSDVTGGPLSSSSSTGFQRPQRALENNAAADDGGEDTTTDEDNSQYRVQPFVEGVSDYSGYQQAWRLLGFMIDCDSTSNNNNKNNNKRGRLLGESHDENGTGEGCQRYVVWAAVRCRPCHIPWKCDRPTPRFDSVCVSVLVMGRYRSSLTHAHTYIRTLHSMDFLPCLLSSILLSAVRGFRL